MAEPGEAVRPLPPVSPDGLSRTGRRYRVAAPEGYDGDGALRTAAAVTGERGTRRLTGGGGPSSADGAVIVGSAS